MLDYISYRLAFRLQQPAKAAAVEVCDDGAGLAVDAAEIEGDCAGGEGVGAEEDAGEGDEAEEDSEGDAAEEEGEGDVAEEDSDGDVAEEDSEGDAAEEDSDYCEDDGTEEDGANGEGDEAGPSSRDIAPTGQRLVVANASQARGTPSTSTTASTVEVPHSYGALFHQWCVDAWCRNEQNRLNWFRRESSQTQLRADLYKS